MFWHFRLLDFHYRPHAFEKVIVANSISFNVADILVFHTSPQFLETVIVSQSFLFMPIQF